jgi:hypothetical protein
VYFPGGRPEDAMIQFLFAGENLPFTSALAVMVGIAVLEAVGTLIGLSSAAHSAGDAHLDLDAHGAPDLHADVHADVHADLHADAGTDFDGDVHADLHDAPAGGEVDHELSLSSFLGWLGLGRMPLMVWLVVVLTSFGLTGLVLQAVVRELAGGLLPAGVAAPVALFLCLPVLRVSGNLLVRILPKDETSAVAERSFVGQLAVVVLGTARRGQPAQAKLKDPYGQTHYLLVEPGEEEEAFETGTQVLLVDRAGAVFTGVRNSYATLAD